METVNSIRLTVRGKRRALGLSQAEVAMRAGVSRKWLSEFEPSKVKAERERRPRRQGSDQPNQYNEDRR